MQQTSTFKRESIIKMVLVGESGVGKTCLLLRYSENKFSENITTTVGIDFRTKRIDCEGNPYTIQIWDTAGQERFRTIVPNYYRGVMGIAMIYDVTSKESFKNIEYWTKNVKENADEGYNLMLIGNKSDLEQQRVVSYEEGRELAEKLGIPFLETSAANSDNVKKMVMTMVEAIIKGERNEESAAKPTQRIAVNTQNSQPQQKMMNCC
ncbi:hypothetical protein EIN_253330 [Entamoeba invadens IP1]|uniref:Uncharacterized protein n=1 Tax=Entamoeba invadens IP1 TaxID=370355 RepID=A0A0A1UGR1_ENTIV|nr:hypothetical protein EIN_253330 [Entamoeba invadens IP1]ELP95069.1 hypothetical protein EIN_253330 [Entamoeba invadens IP1]|eukprot:XP_004261840.1 hypothetical protein EIN_253330 [Entamoeba invadens IP1]